MKNIIFEKYRSADLKIINCLKNDEEDVTLLDERREIIEELISLKIDKEEFKKIYNEMGLDKLDKEIKEILSNKAAKIKKDIQMTAMANKTNKGYAAANRVSNFFSIKV